jgi:hypothetical protein
LEPGPFEPPPIEPRDFTAVLTSSEHHAIDALVEPRPLAVPAPGTVLMVLLAGAGLSAPRRREPAG